MAVSMNRLTRLALISLFIFSALGLYFADRAREPSIVEFIGGQWAMWSQISLGFAVGLLSGWVAWWWIKQDFMSDVRNKYVNLFKSFRLSTADIVVISLCAGIGEELFFRGAIQSYLGVIWTSILFVALHGYLNPRDWAMASYGLLMTLIIVALGYMTETIGIVSSIVAHVMIDLYLLYQMRRA